MTPSSSSDATAYNYKRAREGIAVRVVEYTLDPPGPTPSEPPEQRYRLLTTILDPDAAPAAELAAARCRPSRLMRMTASRSLMTACR